MPYTKTFTENVFVPCVTQANGLDSKSFTITGSRTGSRVDGWRQKIELGLQAGSVYSSDRRKVVLYQPQQDSLVRRYLSPPFTVVGETLSGFICAQRVNSTLGHLTVSTSEARSMALSKLYKKLEETFSQSNTPAVLAELGGVIRQFGRPFEAMVQAIDLHYSRLHDAKKRLIGPLSYRRNSFRDLAARTWLETSFGLLPLISDTQKAAESLARFYYEADERPPLPRTIKARASVSNTNATNIRRTAQGTVLNYVVSETVTTEARAQYICGLAHDLRADFGSNERLLQLFGLDIRNVPLAIWEAVPWSWLLDYFVNVQSILEAGAALTTNVSWVVLGETRVTTQKLRCSGGPSIPPNWSLVSYTSLKSTNPNRPVGGVDNVRTTFSRTLPTGLGVPPLYIRHPFGDLKKVANLSALVLRRKTEDSKLWLF